MKKALTMFLVWILFLNTLYGQQNGHSYFIIREIGSERFIEVSLLQKGGDYFQVRLCENLDDSLCNRKILAITNDKIQSQHEEFNSQSQTGAENIKKIAPLLRQRVIHTLKNVIIDLEIQGEELDIISGISANSILTTVALLTMYFSFNRLLNKVNITKAIKNKKVIKIGIPSVLMVAVLVYTYSYMNVSRIEQSRGILTDFENSFNAFLDGNEELYISVEDLDEVWNVIIETF